MNRRNLLQACLVLVMVVLACTRVLDRTLDAAVPPLSVAATEARLERAQKAAALAYASARVLNAIVAVASSTTANVEVLVAGGSVDLGMVLEPAEKLIETFADVMMISLIAITMQIFLVEIGGYYGLPWLLAAGLAAIAATLALPRRGPWAGGRRLGTFLMLLGLAARLFIPLSAAASEAISDRFLERHRESAQVSIDAVRAEIAAPPPGTVPDRSWYDPRQLADRMRIPAPDVRQLEAKIDRAVDGIVVSMTIFIFQCMVMPLGFLALTVLGARHVLSRGSGGGAGKGAE